MSELEAAVAAGSSKEAERAQSRRGGGEKTSDEPRPPHLSLEDHKWYDAAIRTKGAVRGGLSYYRASAAGLWPGFLPNWVPAFGLEALRWLHRATASSSISSSITPPLAPPLPPPSEQSDHHSSVIEIPVLVLWGELDRYLGRELAFPPRDLVPNVQGPVFLDGTHWVHLSQPHEVNAQLIKFLSASGKLEGSDRDCETGA
jgi:pimeloyl-ACP methyl ester carboxylesterase